MAKPNFKPFSQDRLNLFQGILQKAELQRQTIMRELANLKPESDMVMGELQKILEIKGLGPEHAQKLYLKAKEMVMQRLHTNVAVVDRMSASVVVEIARKHEHRDQEQMSCEICKAIEAADGLGQQVRDEVKKLEEEKL